MAVRKRARSRIVIDMTPMVDISFLLVIFFMSTYHARPPETVQVNLPMSRSPFKVPESDVMIVSIVPPARAVGLADSINPTVLLSDIARYHMSIDSGGMGLKRNLAIDRAASDMKQPARVQQALSEAASMKPEQLRARADSLMFWWNLGRDASQPINFDNLSSVIYRERSQNPRLRMIIKADKEVESGTILRLMAMLQDPAVNMLRFSMMTMFENVGSSIFVRKGG